MTKQSIPNFSGGLGLVKELGPILTELQGLTISLLAGAAANTKIDLAAIRTGDTVLAALNNSAGTLTDITGTLSIVGTYASGTVTASAVAAADTVTVNGRVFTAIGATDKPVGNQFSIGTSNALCAAHLAAIINRAEIDDPVSNLKAAAEGAVVTITAVAEGTGGNAIALATSSNVRLAKSSTTLAGGSATGGVMSSGITNQLVLFWYNKS